jgi:tetrahydromethanopterin S-methyltransferase subunit E
MSARVRIRIEQGLAILTGFLGLLTIFWRDWIEGLTGWDPDHHSGSAEVGIIVGLLVVSIVLFLVSRVEIRRASSATPVA